MQFWIVCVGDIQNLAEKHEYSIKKRINEDYRVGKTFFLGALKKLHIRLPQLCV